jgi:hypothetical protein
MNRRGFLGRMLGGIAVAPVAAQEVLTAGIQPALGAFPPLTSDPGPNPISRESTRLPRQAAIALIRNTPGMMDMARTMARERAFHVDRLDPDLAANRAFSLTTKVRIQRERQTERRLAEILDPQERIWRQFYEKGIDL